MDVEQPQDHEHRRDDDEQVQPEPVPDARLHRSRQAREHAIDRTRNELGGCEVRHGA
jgi:hypothetical protein